MPASAPQPRRSAPGLPYQPPAVQNPSLPAAPRGPVGSGLGRRRAGQASLPPHHLRRSRGALCVWGAGRASGRRLVTAQPTVARPPPRQPGAIPWLRLQGKRLSLSGPPPSPDGGRERPLATSELAHCAERPSCLFFNPTPPTKAGAFAPENKCSLGEEHVQSQASGLPFGGGGPAFPAPTPTLHSELAARSLEPKAQPPYRLFPDCVPRPRFPSPSSAGREEGADRPSVDTRAPRGVFRLQLGQEMGPQLLAQTPGPRA